ncbi:Gamma-glutamyl phosphate reductase [Neochlamydia sp. AcF65]|uniref:glutamate-5-semialdehyde dehydrogenase n=1 Tax=Neochlamydia sp. AcF65 TaxID=2795735 RepID=UPI001BC9BA95|nr:glutamate-5-semialdehyde dehydrogenase [Neochlamydia sp. AcF65]MBS4167051.1 Gamma-glutamyl phosphate reductase [Neochlamydia sp. AcF65]
MDRMMADLDKKTNKAKNTALILSNASESQKNLALSEISKALSAYLEEIKQANLQDLSQSGEDKKKFSELGCLDQMIECISDIRRMPDLNGEIFDDQTLSNGLKLAKYRVPIGVLGYVLDINPAAIMRVAALTIKSGNSLIIWAGKEINNTCCFLVKIIQMGLEAADLPIESVQLLPSHDEEQLKDFIQCKKSVDLVLLAGSASLTSFCQKNSLIPLVYENKNVGHLYIDLFLNSEKALDVITNAKMQEVEATYSLSTLLVHEALADSFLPALFKTLLDKNISLRLDGRCWNLWVSCSLNPENAQLAVSQDWDTAWHSNALNIKLVKGMEEAIEHIHLHGSGSCDGILSDHPVHAMQFSSLVSSEVIMINSSLRFLDETLMGEEPETLNNLHKLRLPGPITLKELMSYKRLVQGNYHVCQ